MEMYLEIWGGGRNSRKAVIIYEALIWLLIKGYDYSKER